MSSIIVLLIDTEDNTVYEDLTVEDFQYETPQRLAAVVRDVLEMHYDTTEND